MPGDEEDGQVTEQYDGIHGKNERRCELVADIKRTTEGLEHCIARYIDGLCDDCPYMGAIDKTYMIPMKCKEIIMRDALELLKEQQEVREHLSKGVGRLNKLLDKKNAEIARLIEARPVHCKDCEIRDKGMACVCSTGDDWFCADGKQKERGDHD